MRLLVLLLLAPVLLAQPRVSNAKMESRAAGNLETTLQSIIAAQNAPAWIGYSVPAVPGNGESGGCFLEGRNNYQGRTAGPVLLEGSATLIVLFRASAHAIEKIRAVPGDCELDAGGLPFIYLTGVRPADSIAFLETQVTTGKGNQPLVVIAMHGDPAADACLKRLAASPSADIREKTMFALTIRKNPEAVNTLLQAAKNDQSPKVRSQALFWLAQKAGQKEAAAITDAVSNDPDLEVKKRALFALTQLPAGEGVPKLIEIARTHKTPEVRKQAMFWLGQSKDPRALAFFEQVLR